MKRTIIIAQALLMVFAAISIVSFIYTMLINIFILITQIPEISPQIDYCLMVMAVMIAIVLFYLWYRRYAGKGKYEQAKLKDIITLKKMGIYLIMGVGCQLFLSGILTIVRPLFERLFSYYDETISALFDADPIIVAVYVIILAPIVEELMLRGILFNRLRNGVSFTAANLIQATVFGLYHWDIIQGIYAFGIGLILGYVYERSKTLLAPIIVHVLINGLGLLLQWLQPGFIPISLAIIAGGVFLFGGIYLFTKSSD